MEIVVKECELESIIIARHIVLKYVLASQPSTVVNIINYALFILIFN